MIKHLLWLSLIPLTAFWLFSVDIYGPSLSQALSVVSIIMGIAISIAGLWRAKFVFDNRYTVVLAPLVISCLIIPYPYNVGLIVTAVALLISLIAPRLGRVWLGILLAGVILTIQTLTLLIYYIFAPNFHQASFLSPVLAYLSDLAGLNAASNEGMVFVFAQGNVFPVTITLEKLGFYPWILIFAGSIILIFLKSRSSSDFSKRVLSILILSFIYLLVRYLILVQIFFSSDLPEYARNRLEIFIDPWWLMASFIPLVLLFLWLYPMDTLKFNFRLNIDSRQAIAFAAVMISVLFLTSASIFQDPGTRKEGRVLVDEIHSLWEFSTLKLDKNWYGENSTYNAYSMVEWLNDTYRVDRIVSPSYKDLKIPGATKVVPDIVSGNLTYDILKNYDILIIKTPSRYEPDEVDAIVSFVRNGGGLFMIGDHTNFAGTGTNLNQISKMFGIEWGFDSVNTMNGRLYNFKRGQLPHPIVKFMPNLDFMTGSSLKAPLSGEPAILGFGLLAEPGEYSSEGFFRETRKNDPTQVTDTIWGLINQAVTVNYGKGRVVAFPDSTIISNFRVFFGGSPNMIIGVMEYLNRKNSYENARQVLFLIGLMIGGLAAYMLIRMAWGDKRVAVLVVLLALGALSASGAFLLFSTKVEDSIPDQFYVRNHTVSFDAEHSNIIVSQGDQTGQYDTFFIWTQRVNLTPTLETSLDEAMAKGRTVVIIDPIKPLSQGEMAALLSYIKDGNSVLLMMNSEGSWSNMAKYLGLEVYRIKEPLNKTWKPIAGYPIKPWGLSIKGGKPLLMISGRVVLAEAINYGKGIFILFTDSQIFKNGLYGNPGYMGYYMSDPRTVNKSQYDLAVLYNLEFKIFEDYLNSKGFHPTAFSSKGNRTS